MATYTSNYGWTKPSGSDNVDISVLNNNLDGQDGVIHDAFLNMAPPFSESSTYAVDDIVLYTTGLYKCHTAVTVAGAWTGSTNWQVYKLSEGGGGSSLTAGDYIDITAGVISVKKEKGEYSLERYVLQSTGGGAPKLVVKKYIDSELISTNEYMNNTAHVNIDDTLEIWYSYNPYNWHYKLLVDGVDHSAGYEYEFSYADTTEYPVDFHIAAGDSTDLVTKGDLDYADLPNKPSINGVPLSGNKTTSELGIDKTAVGLGNVPNVSTNDQEPTFTEASTRNNIVSGEKLSVILGKIAKFFNDLKTVAFSGSYTDLSDKPTIPAAQVNSDWNASSGVAEILNKPSSYTPSSHKHGNIQNGGTLQTTDVAIANGDKLVVTDSSNSAKIARTSVTFDGTTTTQALSKKGTFETFSKFSGSYNDLSNKPTIPTSASGISYDNTDSGLTATDAQGAVDEVAEKMGNMRMSKLWENPNTSINFDAQTIQLSSSNFDLLLIIARYATTFGGNVSNISSGTSGYVTFGLAGSNGPANYSRIYSVNGNQVTIGDCEMSAHNSPSKVTSNNALIPYQIYGIKLT